MRRDCYHYHKNSNEYRPSSCKECKTDYRKVLRNFVPCYCFFANLMCWFDNRCSRCCCCQYCCPPIDVQYVREVRCCASVITVIALVLFVIFVGLWGVSIRDLDRIQVPCVNTIVWATIDSLRYTLMTAGPCLHSYRRVEWRYPLSDGPIRGYNVDVAQCSWVGTSQPDCDYNYTLSWAEAHWLNVEQLCHIHANSGELWKSFLTPENLPRWLPNMSYGVIALCALVIICVAAYCIMAIRDGHNRLKDLLADVPCK